MSISNFSSSVEQLDVIIEFFQSTPPTAHTLSSLRIQYEEVRLQWDKVKSEYYKLIEPPTSYDSLVLLDAKVMYENISARYLACVTKFDNAKNSRSHSSQNTFAPAYQPITQLYGIRLPPCECDTFEGDYLSWPTFRDLFTAIYINNSELPQVEKLLYLRQKTQGEARELVEKVPLTNAGFPLAWQNLNDKYENNRVLVNSQLRLLLNLPYLTTETSQDIKNLQRTMNNCVSSLQLHGIEVSAWDSILVYICSTRLPEYTLALWE